MRTTGGKFYIMSKNYRAEGSVHALVLINNLGNIGLTVVVLDSKRLHMSTSGVKTSITEIVVANEQLYKVVANRCDVSPKQVEECVDILSKYIKNTMEKGTFDGVMIPYFGKIRVKQRRAQWMNHVKVMPHLPTHLLPKVSPDE